MGMKNRRPKKSSLPPVSLGTTIRENLPYPVVYYPNHYGTFFGFAKDQFSQVVLCACSKSAVDNLLRLKSMQPEIQNANPLREAPLDSWFFPDIIAEPSMKKKEDPLSVVQFEKELCHRCNLTAPTLRYCHEMYGVQFIQYYGWYVNQTYLRLGIHPTSLGYLPDVCPQEYQDDIKTLITSQREFQTEKESLLKIVFGPKREDIRDDEITYWRNVRSEEAEKMISLRKKAAQTGRSFTKKIENITRKEFGFKKVGEGWVSETMLYKIVSRILADYEVVRHHRPDWLEGLELDIYIPTLRVAFEYQGQQHFHPIKHWGGQAALKMLQARDARKVEICKQQGINLITIDYTEPLTEEHIRKVLEDCAVFEAINNNPHIVDGTPTEMER